MSSRTRILLAWTPSVLYTLLIWWLSSQVLEVAFMNRVPFKDKGVHFVEYGALTFFIAFAHLYTWPSRRVAGALTAAAFTTALGLLDELHQGFVPGRFSDLGDLIADALGALIAALLFLVGHALLVTLTRRNQALPAS